MILEGVVTTMNAEGELNVAPMGPVFSPDENQFELKPFADTSTLANLKSTRQGVLNITDDVLLLARAAIHQLTPNPDSFSATKIVGRVLENTCSWVEFRVNFIQQVEARATVKCDVVHRGTLKSWYGFNRAKHAVLEAAILATRVHFLPLAEIETQMGHFATIVEKTGGAREIEAFELLAEYIASADSEVAEK